MAEVLTSATTPLSLRDDRTFGSHVFTSFGEKPIDYTGELVRLLQDVSTASRMISAGVRNVGLPVRGETLVQNPEEIKSGQQHCLQRRDFDAHMATEILYRMLYHDGHLCLILSPTQAEPMHLPDNVPFGTYVLCLSALERDPLFPEWSVCGTLFSIYKRVSHAGQKGTVADLIRKGSEQVAAGYVIYGNSTVLAYSIGNGVHFFTMHPNIKEFFQCSKKVISDTDGKFLHVNNQECEEWDANVKGLVEELSKKDYHIRYTNNLVADFHHLLSTGGIIACPATKKNPTGPLHFLCQAAPLAFLAEQAGMQATNGHTRILDLKPDHIHAHTPMYISSAANMVDIQKHLRPSS
uniref:fructose-bisphosphatase n=1 Tax=Cyanoptyche gloeocystis TaxID=77922 RepID=A0A7S2NPS2_9EUKA|mmetsp:Transcript_2432/g.4451  ORF Transcript_2432/g.4451 Transcript_2432/m.4451 type:complete len:351 (+) Transcript_2432:143-1195(+)